MGWREKWGFDDPQWDPHDVLIPAVIVVLLSVVFTLAEVYLP